jgi:23S rRNA pseudouridine955/2504/2580 synthase
MRHLKGVPRQRIYRILRKGEVRVNGGRVKPTYRIAHADEVRIPPLRRPDRRPVEVDARDVTRLEGAVLFEDDTVIAINKPAGLAVHGGSSIAAGVIEMLRVARDDPKLELAHRLDRDTSGCLLICKRRAVLAEVQQAFRERQVTKVYDVFVQGHWPKHLRSVQKRLLRYETAWGERRVRVDPKGRTARTDFREIARAPSATHLEAVLHTGRTHQIRVHCKSAGHPIVGDRKYGPHEGSASRLCLHAARLNVPLGGTVLKLQAPLDEEMLDLWRRLSQGETVD